MIVANEVSLQLGRGFKDCTRNALAGLNALPYGREDIVTPEAGVYLALNWGVFKMLLILTGVPLKRNTPVDTETYLVM